MSLESTLKKLSAQALTALYGASVPPETIQLNDTPKNFEGDATIVCFPFAKVSGKNPPETAAELGAKLVETHDFLESYNVVKGFLNLIVTPSYWLGQLKEIITIDDYGFSKEKKSRVVLEYCGPNTNKPLHLGHIRNILLGHSLAEILSANGNEVIKVNIYNDRGIAICKSMLAWSKLADGATPEYTGIKGDQFVGKYYIAYKDLLDDEVAEAVANGADREAAVKNARIEAEARELLLKWEAGDPETVALWKRMNGWVYEGFEQTYDALHIDFAKHYFESDSYLKGKDIVEEGLKSGAYYQKEDGSIWVDLTEEGYDHKILLRSDGTSVYITQDLGLAQMRYDEFKMDTSIYIVGNEQDYHFNVLKLALQKLGRVYADSIFHLSYGMVELPSGKMKTREGKVVEADELIEMMKHLTEDKTRELGKIDDLSDDEASELFDMLGLGALKYFILKVNPKKKMLFNPDESIDLQGDTGPFIQYTHARICSVLRRSSFDTSIGIQSNLNLSKEEASIIKQLLKFPSTIELAAENYEPSVIASYCFTLAKLYNKFYAEIQILNVEDEALKNLRLGISSLVADVLSRGMKLLGIQVPQRM